ncbi:MAG: NosD domain-containing protein, partial [Candidatus Acidiferrum sp.]
MKLRSVLLAVLAFPLSSALFASPSSAKQLLVDVDKVACPTAAYTSIQAAVNAASPGDEIRICPGVYVEQVVIQKSLDIEADNGAILMPSAMVPNSTSLLDAAPLAVALLVSSATGVSIDGLIVDGSNSGISECAPDLFGVAFQNASGTISHTTVRNFKLAASLNGCQSGTGIFVQSGGGQISSVNIDATSVHDFQKNGITANELGTQVLIRGNVVTGVGPTTGAAQNGIQIGFGATGSITGNTITNNVWSPCTAIATCTAVATNILVVQSDGVTVSNNSVSVSQVGIFIDGNSAELSGNQSTANSVFDGIRLEGNSNHSRSNTVFNASESGIFLDGNNNVIRDNTITEASIGILKTTTSTGNLIHSNSIFDCPITIQDPSAHSIATLLFP